ncbi:DUF269 domain-containing protein [Gorillibacterium massiliense]|uniref:DUF269 domain-containing protein n=1 Tax=Gorillibacterium massiliense TaxID=1280390 RepID=UPI0004B44166|nr:DUF269 domain-containing protein [Gorillibacterium massiliense]
MSELAVATNDGLVNSGLFLDCLNQVIHAAQPWGTPAKLTPQQKAERVFFLRSGPAKNAVVPNCFGLPDIGQWHDQLDLFFRAVSIAIERQRGLPVCSLVDLNHEGFGRGLVYAGRLVLVVKSLRGGNPLFTTLEQAAKTGEIWVQQGLEWLDRYPEIAKV